MDYRKIADEVAEKILSYSQDAVGWKVIKVSKNVMVSSKLSKEYAGDLYCGEGIIKEVPAKVIPFIVEYAGCPPTPSCVRGYNNPCGYVCLLLARNPRHPQLGVFIQPQLRGMLPGLLVEMALPATLVNLITETRAGLEAVKNQNSA